MYSVVSQAAAGQRKAKWTQLNLEMAGNIIPSFVSKVPLVALCSHLSKGARAAIIGVKVQTRRPTEIVMKICQGLYRRNPWMRLFFTES